MSSWLKHPGAKLTVKAGEAGLANHEVLQVARGWNLALQDYRHQILTFAMDVASSSEGTDVR